ncbi:hypothetical protein [Microbacterium enclense]|uniref:hypothetical protein n=1 Tax=Microbacterium enclense TaxID=993073 RepID=UPI003F820283
MDDLDVAFPPQLCDECARPLDADFVEAEGHSVALSCPVHGLQSLVDPTVR